MTKMARTVLPFNLAATEKTHDRPGGSDGIHGSLPCNFYRGATFGFGLHGGDVLGIVQQPTH